MREGYNERNKIIKEGEVMRKGMKTVLFAGAVAGLTLGGTMVSFAGTWKTGEGSDQNKWWYDFEDGSYAANGWQWIDGNNDGVAECYYFDPSGWMLTGTSTPDGYTVNADGAWTENGSVQTKAVETQAAAGASGQDGQGQAAGGDFTWMLNADGSCNYDVWDNDYSDFYNCMSATGAWESTLDLEGSARTKRMVEIWAENSERGAAWKRLFDRYAIPYDLGSGRPATINLTTPAGMTKAEEASFGMATDMMITINNDGMASTSWEANYNEDTTISIVNNVQYFG